LFPNPIGSQFSVYIHGLQSSTASIHIWNASGQLIFTKQAALVNGGDYSIIPCAAWAAGIYTIRIQTPDGFSWVRKNPEIAACFIKNFMNR
jgi:hypothetical protein